MTDIDRPQGSSTVPRIEVHLFAGAAAAYGADTATVRAATLGAAVDQLRGGASAEAARVIDRSSLLVNAVACTEHDRVLTEGDRVDVLPPFAGG
ncbi:MoaD/ThiS family protein [Brachybacterium sp. AOP43-C2-M15]|uniref:MoaD/ThiS family protein n=1 Tax=Brachybacterium sp. AOP43-C2-M15 TaxID=3457661 RepID=UPI0040349AB4